MAEFELVIVTGLSGSGKSVAVDALEDMDFFCIDNMPPKLIATFMQSLSETPAPRKRIAVVTDIRVGDAGFPSLFDSLEQLRQMQYPYKLLYMDAHEEVLVRRFKETRRKHPLLEQCGDSLPDAIRMERTVLQPAKQIADYVIDTTLISAAQCKQQVTELIMRSAQGSMHVRCQSFGYKYGLPNDADLVFDVRCLPNPFYVPELKALTGLDKPVYDYVIKWDEAKQLASKLFDLLDFLLPLYSAEGKSQLVIAVGCTGGKHRSVVFTQLLCQHIQGLQYTVSGYHRDLQK